MLIFEKFKIWAFRKVYGLWGYLQPVKSYGALKSKMGTVTDLSLEISHLNHVFACTNMFARAEIWF